jgi:ribosomal protein S18 acetylase RimI-like enzyme
MIDEIKIRDYKAQDKAVLAEMYCRLNTETFSWMPKGTFSNSDFDKDTKGEVILVAERSGELLGFVSALVSENFIHQLYVDTNAQGCGLGKILLDAGVQRLGGKKVYLDCRVKNESAFRFYKKYGFEVESEMEYNKDLYYKLILSL